MKKFMKKILGLLPILIILIFVNYFIDPGNIFYKKGFYEKGIVNLILRGKNVENLTNYDERLLQKIYSDKQNKRKDIIVLGSSRAMQISKDILHTKNMFNSSVSGASLEDIISVYGLYKRKKVLPKKIIIGLDPWILNKNNNQKRWKSIDKSYFYMMNIMNFKDKIRKTIDNKYLELLSLSYFQNGVYSLNKNSEVQYDATDKTYGKTNIKRIDGSLGYNEKFRDRSLNEVKKIAKSYGEDKPIYCLGDFKELDKDYKSEFETFIYLIKKDGVDIEFFMCPYYPYVYKKIINSDDYKIVDKVEKYFKEFGIKNNIKVYGSYNPKTVGCTEEDFYDGMHVKPSGIKKIFK